MCSAFGLRITIAALHFIDILYMVPPCAATATGRLHGYKGYCLIIPDYL